MSFRKKVPECFAAKEISYLKLTSGMAVIYISLRSYTISLREEN